MAEKIIDFAHEATFVGECAIPRAGKTKPLIIEFEFNYLERDAFQQFLMSVHEKSNVEIIQGVAKGWQNVDMEFTPTNIESLLKHNVNADVAILNYWIKEHKKAAEKN